MTSHEQPPDQPLVFGVPATDVAAALRGAGLDENAVVTILGRGIAATAQPAATDGDTGFHFQTQIAQTAAECTLTYQRLFTHPDFIDGVTVVQAGSTPEEMGFNARFHALEAELDAISRDLHTSSNCVAELRRELFGLAGELEAKITEIDRRLDAKGKDKDTKEGKESKEGKEGKESKEKDTKEGKDKEGKDSKEHKDGKEHKDVTDKLAPVEKLAHLENQPLAPHSGEASAGGTQRTFITVQDRPPVGEEALKDEDAAGPEPEPEPARRRTTRRRQPAGDG